MKKIKISLLFITLACLSTLALENTSSKVYMIAEIKILNNELYVQYVEKVPKIVKKYGGRYLVRGGKITPMSGDWDPEKIIIIEFENIEQLKECFNSPEYLAVAPLRERSTIGKSIIVESPVESH
jgi:uncharacterized protein (DUF1330 family)